MVFRTARLSGAFVAAAVEIYICPAAPVAQMVATPKAIDSPADPVVWTILFSRMVERPRTRNRVIESTAMGIEALTVMPTLSARYTEEAAKTIPSIAPMKTARKVNSRGDSWGEMKGLKSDPDMIPAFVVGGKI